jgi:hypothetical protein
MESRDFGWNHLLLPPMVALLTMFLLHIVIAMFLPLRWPAIRAEFQRHLEIRLLEELESAYGDLPFEVSRDLLQERRTVEKYVTDIHEVGGWLEQREQAANITGLYGK